MLPFWGEKTKWHSEQQNITHSSFAFDKKNRFPTSLETHQGWACYKGVTGVEGFFSTLYETQSKPMRVNPWQCEIMRDMHLCYIVTSLFTAPFIMRDQGYIKQSTIIWQTTEFPHKKNADSTCLSWGYVTYIFGQGSSGYLWFFFFTF